MGPSLRNRHSSSKAALKGEFQRANILRTKLLGLLQGKLLIIQVVWVIEALKRLRSTIAIE
jgi:hypothetical protein